jgi:hypothetical protein
MQKLIFRLLVLILGVYLAGSIYPLLAHEVGHSHAPPPARPPGPAPPVKAPEAPPMLDTKGPQIPPPPPLDTLGEPTTRGCGGPITDTYTKAEAERKAWRKNDFDAMANEKINKVKEMANLLITSIKEDIKAAQDEWHEKDLTVDDYRHSRVIHYPTGEIKGPKSEEFGYEKKLRKWRWEKLQRQQGRLEKAEAWRHQKIGEIQALRDRAKSGDYLGYLGLKDYECIIPPGLMK